MAANDELKDSMVEVGNTKWTDLLAEKMALMKKTQDHEYKIGYHVELIDRFALREEKKLSNVDHRIEIVSLQQGKIEKESKSSS